MSDLVLPVIVLTGFLGSGKTTLLSQLLRAPGMAETAVVINEFGEVGLDHHLVQASKEDMVVMDSGCLCCTVRGDLVNTLQDLHSRRQQGEFQFKRLVIETTGLADPAPIVQTLMSDQLLSQCYSLHGLLTCLDAVNGLDQMDQQPEAVKQVAMADKVILTKTDLVQERGVDLVTLVDRLQLLNPSVDIQPVIMGEVDPEVLFDFPSFDPDVKSLDVQRWLGEIAFKDGLDAKHPGHDHSHSHSHDVNRHDAAIHSFCLTFDAPIDWDRLAMAMDLLCLQRGQDLLRVKGLLNVQGLDKPVALHGVQHIFHPPVILDAWPDEADKTSRIVFIVRHMEQATVARMLDDFLKG